MEDDGEIAEHELAGNRQDDDSEELTDDIQRRLTQIFGKPVGSDKHQIKHQHTEEQGDTQTRHAILRRDSQQCREGTRTGVHGERQRHDRTAGTDLALQFVVLEDRDIQHHLQRHKEDDKSSGDREMLDLDAEKLQDPFAQKEERQKNHQTRDTHFLRMDLDPLLLHRDRNRDIPEGIDDRDHENKGR